MFVPCGYDSFEDINKSLPFTFNDHNLKENEIYNNLIQEFKYKDDAKLKCYEIKEENMSDGN